MFDSKGRAAGRWRTTRAKLMRTVTRERGLIGDALYAAVMGIAAADSSLVKIEARA